MHKAVLADQGIAKLAAEAAKNKVEACTKKVAAAVANCKGVKYALAQKTYNDWDSK